jgi:hypothetical protein
LEAGGGWFTAEDAEIAEKNNIATDHNQMNTDKRGI